MIQSKLKFKDKIIKGLYFILLIYFAFLMIYYSILIASYSLTFYNLIHFISYKQLTKYLNLIFNLLILITFNMKHMRKEKFSSWEKITKEIDFFFIILLLFLLISYDLVNHFRIRVELLHAILNRKHVMFYY